MVADDLGKQLSCYGAQMIQTPNIDQLASQGTRFDYAFASTASCSGSRSVIYTGLHTHQNGQYGLANGNHHFVLLTTSILRHICSTKAVTVQGCWAKSM